MEPSIGQPHHAVLNFGSGSGVPNHWWFNRPITLLHDLSADQCLESNLQPFRWKAEMLTTAPTRCCCQCQILTLIHPNCQGRDIHDILRTSYARCRVSMQWKLIFDTNVDNYAREIVKNQFPLHWNTLLEIKIISNAMAAWMWLGVCTREQWTGTIKIGAIFCAYYKQ